MLIFEIIGDPIPQQQTRKAKGFWYDPSKKSKEQIQWQIKPYAPRALLTGALQVDITFFFPIPKGTSAIRRRQMLNGIIHHTKKPDADNCSYIVTNAMKNIVFEDDKQIVDLASHKRFGEVTKTVVRINELESIAKVCPDD